AAGSMTLPHPFVFPNGLSCANFDQIAVASQSNWELARDSLRRGLFADFLMRIGRIDLAQTARRASAEQDADQGLHELLGSLPAAAPRRPRLQVEPTEISLGQLTGGTKIAFDLAIVNQGMQLLYGSIESDVDWLAIGDGANSRCCIFRTPGE